ncbi:MAG: hypothetical protein PVG66_08615 [Chromatiales bacterium]
MDSSSIQLNGSEIESISLDGNEAKVFFSRAIIIKTMTGSVEKTKWWQKGYLIFGDAEIETQPGNLPLTCAGGDVGENVYTYRDMIPVPLDSRGRAHCNLYFQDSDERLIIEATSVRLEMLDVPKYIEHIRPPSA